MFNQSTELSNYNAYTSDHALQSAVKVYGGEWATEHLTNVGKIVGSKELQDMSVQVYFPRIFLTRTGEQSPSDSQDSRPIWKPR